MTDHHRRISAKHLKMAEDTIKVRLRGEKYRLYKRKCCNVGVYVSGNEVSNTLRLVPGTRLQVFFNILPDAYGQGKRFIRSLGNEDGREPGVV